MQPIRTLLLFAVLAPAAAAQFQPGDLVVTNYRLPAAAFVVPAGGGAVSPLPTTVPLVGPSGLAATSRGEIAIADFDADQLVLVAPSGAATVVARNAVVP